MDSDREDAYSEDGEDRASPSPPNSSDAESDDPTVASHSTQLPVFARQSINLLTGSSNSGKTQLLLSILRDRQRFFPAGAAKNVIYVHCNFKNRDAPLENPFENELDLSVDIFNLYDVNLTALLNPGAVVILDDVVELTPEIKHMLTYATHHHDVTLFMVTQGLLKSELFRALYQVHNLVLNFGNTATVNLGRLIVKQFFMDRETKDRLLEIFGLSHKHRMTVVLKLNEVASAPEAYKNVLCFANIDQLCDSNRPYCLVYPRVGSEEVFEESMNFGPEVKEDTFVVVKAQHVRKKRKRDEASEEEDEEESGPESKHDKKKIKKEETEEEERWNDMYQTVVEQVRLAFKPNKWSSVIFLLKEILRVKKFILSSKEDGFRSVLIKGKKKLRISLIDFLNVLSRRSYPNEDTSKFSVFVPFVKLLLANRVPLSFIKNAKLTELANAARKKIGKHVKRLYADGRHRKRQRLSRRRSPDANEVSAESEGSFVGTTDEYSD